jgi:hypothetical protein
MRRKRFLSGLSVLFLVNIFALSVFGNSWDRLLCVVTEKPT